MNDTIFITGISGSGKSTTANKFTSLGYEVIHLDEISKYYQKGRPIKNEYIKYFIYKITGGINYHTTWERDNNLIINSFIKYITQIDGKFVVEGIHLLMPYIDREYLMNYDIYILNTPSIVSTIRRVKRGIGNDISLKSKIINIIKYDLNPVWIIDDIKFCKFKRYMKKRNKKLVVL